MLVTLKTDLPHSLNILDRCFRVETSHDLSLLILAMCLHEELSASKRGTVNLTAITVREGGASSVLQQDPG